MKSGVNPAYLASSSKRDSSRGKSSNNKFKTCYFKVLLEEMEMLNHWWATTRNPQIFDAGFEINASSRSKNDQNTR